MSLSQLRVDRADPAAFFIDPISDLDKDASKKILSKG